MKAPLTGLAKATSARDTGQRIHSSPGPVLGCDADLDSAASVGSGGTQDPFNSWFHGDLGSALKWYCQHVSVGGAPDGLEAFFVSKVFAGVKAHIAQGEPPANVFRQRLQVLNVDGICHSIDET